jgi:hypothetical protein
VNLEVLLFCLHFFRKNNAIMIQLAANLHAIFSFKASVVYYYLVNVCLYLYKLGLTKLFNCRKGK